MNDTMNDMNNDGKRQRLIRLGSEKLADALLDLAERSDEAHNLVERLVSLPKKNIRRFKSRLRALKKKRKFIDWRGASGFARGLEDILEDLRAGVEDPHTGVELVIEFFKCDCAAFGRADDSNGMIGDVFSRTARDLFSEYAERCPDKEWIIEQLIDLYRKDDYGVRDALIDAANEFLPEESLRALAERLWQLAEKEPRDSHEKQHWLLAVESLARQLKDAPLFEKARCAGWPELTTPAFLDIARVYLEAGDAETALSWTKRVPEEEMFRAYERDNLLMEIYEKRGDKDKLAEVAWRIFRRHRSESTLSALLNIIGEDARAEIIKDEVNIILASKRISYSDAGFLINVGQIGAAENYLLHHADELNGDSYEYLLPLARGMEKHERFLAASVIYRALLDSILRRAQSRYYHHGVRYLRKLDSMAERISDWKGFSPQDAYKAGLLQGHGRKSSFWSRYRE